MTDLEKEIKRLSGLVQYKKLDKSVLEQKAQLSLWKRHADLESRFGQKKDKELAKKLFNSYTTNYTIQSFTDIQNLVDLVYEEVMQQRIQQDIDSILADENNRMVPGKQIDSLHSIQDRIWNLKEKIGITKSDKKDDLTVLQELEKKFNDHIHFNRNEFTLYCPYKCSECGKEDVEPLLLRRRVKDFDVLKHPAFSGRFLYNVAIIDDVKKGLITKEQASKYLHTSESYITWAIKNERKNININGISQNKIDELVNNNSHLRNADQYNK